MHAARIVMRQIQEIMENPMEGIRIQPTDDLHVVEVEMQGPEDTPFAGGVFEMQLILGEDYPHTAPKGFFKTKVFHPNVADPRGDICVNTLKRDWDPSLGLRHVLAVIRCLLIEPNPESALNEEAGKLLLENYAEFSKRARMMTMVHAMKNNNKNQNNNNGKNQDGAEQESKHEGSPDAAASAVSANEGENQENMNDNNNNNNMMKISSNNNNKNEDASNSSSSTTAQNQNKTSTNNATTNNKAATDKRRAMLKRL
jgi:ubiquitin-conjugating enzyme E2 S